MTEIPKIAIVGAGFSGTLVAVQLALQSKAPLHVTLYDAHGAFRRGVAYGTRDASHLLNVRADKMGAFEDRQDDFYRWLLAYEKDWRVRRPELASLIVKPDGFLPRMLYGDYIESLFETAKQNTKGVIIEEVRAEVTDAMVASDFITLTLDGKKKQAADRLVLAIGNLLAGSHGFEKAVEATPRYTGNLWSPPTGSILTRHPFTDEDAPVLIIGSGLTMVDMLLSLRHKGYKGKIIAVSRHGLLPQPHDTSVAPYARFLPPDAAPRTALGLFARIRKEIRLTRAGKADWRAVVDSLRADTQALWAALPDAERRKLTRVLAYWSVHRHRMPVSSAEFIARERHEGTLEIRAGRIDHITEDKNRLLAEVITGGKKDMVAAAHVLNCAGPGMNIDRSNNPLLLSLARQGLIERGPVGMGIRAEENGHVKSKRPGHIFALGPLLMGEKLETIAVPELRYQAEIMAGALLSSL